ncbi:MAG: FkbM family methyltransferase [bacterium]|nr:FkbM family methyltransferase [bacterium]
MHVRRRLVVLASVLVAVSAASIVLLAVEWSRANPKPEVANLHFQPMPMEVAVEIYGNRAEIFARTVLAFNRPDKDWRSVLDDRLSEAEPVWSQGYEELIIRDCLDDRKGGFFLDIGCANAREMSTTFYLEQELGWTGFGVDVMSKFAEEWEEFRPNSKFFPNAIADTDGEKLTLYVGAINTLDEEMSQFGSPEEVQEIVVTTVTINTLLAQNGVEKVDFLSLDIEGAEMPALKGFDIQRYKPDLCCVESRHEDLLVDYFTSNGYELIEKYRKADKVNWYFRPVAVE